MTFRKLYIVCTVCLLFQMAAAQHGVTMLPEKPGRGDAVTIVYRPGAGGAIPAEADSVTLVFTYSNFYELPWKMPMEKRGDAWQVSFTVPFYGVYATYYLESGEHKQYAGEHKHYAVPVYAKDAKRVEDGYLYESYSLSAQMGKDPALLTRQRQLLEKELQLYPSNYEARIRMLQNKMVSTKNEKEKQEYRRQALQIIAEKFYEHPGDMGTLNRVTMAYLIIGENSRLDSIRQVVREKYPDTEVGLELRADDIRDIRDDEERRQAAEDALRRYKEASPKDLAAFHEILFHYYLGKKDVQNVLYHLHSIPADTSPYQPVSYKNNAKLLAEQGILLDTAMAYAQKALGLADKFPAGLIRYFPETGYLPAYVTKEARAAKTRAVRAELLSLMGVISFKQGNEKEAEAKIAEALRLSEDPETLQNALWYYERKGEYQRSYETSRQLVLQEPDDTAAFAAMKRNYGLWKGGMQGWEQEVASMDAIWKEKMTEELLKQRVRFKLPVLNPLLDLKGNAVPETLTKDKIVVIDFWATWCVPCMQEMPYLQRVYDKYKNNPDVVFMVLNSGSKNTLKDAQGWWGNKKYSFPVYYTSDRTVGEKFGFNVIPATYVVDKKGVVNFRTIGFEGPMIEKKLSAAIDILLQEGS